MTNPQTTETKIAAAARRLERELAKIDKAEAERISWCNIGQVA